MALTQVASGLIASVAGSTITGSQSIPKSTLPTGSVLQVVQYSTNTGGSIASTSSTTFSSTGFGVTITPTSATSKVFVLVNSTAYAGTGALTILFTIYRGSTNLALTGGSSAGLVNMYTANGANTGWPLCMNILDSPATTSATTYTVYMAASGSSGNFGTSIGFSGQVTSTITAMEIAA